jgi:membrane protein YqaA with SNARE-associated domain
MLTQLRSKMKMLMTPMQPMRGAEPAALTESAPTEPSDAVAPVTLQSRAKAIAMLMLAIAISALVLALSTRFRDALLAFGQLGLVGLFILSIIGNATVFIPAPVFVVACAAGPIYGPVATGVVAGLGSAIGELTGYMAGYGGTAVLPQGQIYQRLHTLMQRFGPLVIFVLAVLPNPAFDVGGLIAGALKMPPLLFLIATAAGKIVRLTLVAWACNSGVPWLTQIMSPPTP